MGAIGNDARLGGQQRTATEQLDEVSRAGFCSKPVRLVGQVADRATGEIRSSSLTISCKDRREILCPACSALYKTDAWILVSTGLIGGKGVPASISMHPKCFVTLTAPSFGAVHRQLGHAACHEGPPRRCRHGSSLGCAARHSDDDPLLGSPLCLRCHDDRAAVLWNAAASRLWSRFIVEIVNRHAIPWRFRQVIPSTDLHFLFS
jgi:hypothetical protein